MLTGHGDESKALNDRLHARTLDAHEHASAEAARIPLRVFVVLGVGADLHGRHDRSYVGKLIGLAGGTRTRLRSRDAYGAYSAEALVAVQPDVLVADPTRAVAIRPRPAALERACAPSASIASHIFRTRRFSNVPVPRYNDGLAWLIATLNATRV